MPTKRFVLPKRLNVALSEKAYENLRSLNEKYHYGNNYLLTILLENIDTIARDREVRRVFEDFKAEYGAPAAGSMAKKR